MSTQHNVSTKAQTAVLEGLPASHAATYFALAREREAIRRRRAAGQPWPWTDDRIFREQKFTNVHREHDATTVWFREHVRSKLDSWRVIEATIAFRFFNRIETGEVLKDLLLDGWDRDEAARRLSRVEGPLWTGAYRIRGEHGKPKLASTLDSIEAARQLLPARAIRWGTSLRDAWSDLCEVPYLGPFTAYEVVTDLRWTAVLAHAADINEWANCGPGCAMGLGWVFFGDLHRFEHNSYSARDQQVLLPLLRHLLEMSRDPQLWPYADAPWELREAEMWACEVAKYIRCRDHGQAPRNRYRAPVARQHEFAFAF